MNVACQCRAINFKTPLPRPLALYICHCTECRRQSGSAFSSSAIFPRFPLPGVPSSPNAPYSSNSPPPELSCYTRLTASGHHLNCYFCRNCGTRMVHSTPGKSVVAVKSGCIDGLTEEDWRNARHIWTKNAMVPIPEGVETCEEEPDEDKVPGSIAEDRKSTDCGVRLGMKEPHERNST